MESITELIIKHIVECGTDEPCNIIFEGQPAAGKSTFFAELLEYVTNAKDKLGLEVHVATESVEDNIELFKNYRENPKEYAFEFQKWIINKKFQQLKTKIDEHNTYIFDEKNEEKKKKKKMVLLMDRSFESDYHVFCKKHQEDGNLTQEQFEELGRMLESMRQQYPCLLEPSVLVYIDISPKKALRRLQERARSGEENYTLSEMERLYKMYKHLNDTLWDDSFQEIAQSTGGDTTIPFVTKGHKKGFNKKLINVDNSKDYPYLKKKI